MFSTEMPHLVIRHMDASCGTAKRAVNLWLTLNFNQYGDSIRIIGRMEHRLRAPRRMRCQAKLHQAADGLRPARRVTAISTPQIELFHQYGLQPNLDLLAPAGGRTPPLFAAFHDPAPHKTDYLMVSEIIIVNNANFAGTLPSLMHFGGSGAIFKRDCITRETPSVAPGRRGFRFFNHRPPRSLET
jgi:hypothetical protein